MSRSGYNEEYDDEWRLIMWRGAVASAVRGKRGQAFLGEMLAVLDAMPEKRLISDALEAGDQVCAIGAVGKARGLDMSQLNPDDRETVASAFGISRALAQEIAYENDEAGWGAETPERRFERMRRWIASLIRSPAP